MYSDWRFFPLRLAKHWDSPCRVNDLLTHNFSSTHGCFYCKLFFTRWLAMKNTVVFFFFPWSSWFTQRNRWFTHEKWWSMVHDCQYKVKVIHDGDDGLGFGVPSETDKDQLFDEPKEETSRLIWSYFTGLKRNWLSIRIATRNPIPSMSRNKMGDRKTSGCDCPTNEQSGFWQSNCKI